MRKNAKDMNSSKRLGEELHLYPKDGLREDEP